MPRNILALCAVLLMLPGLAGCGFLVGSAAGAGAGYYVGEDERNAGQMAIDVDTYEDTVTLSGTVPSQRLAQRALTTARSVDNVKSVQSKLKVVPSAG